MRPSRTAAAPSVRAVNTPARRLHPRAIGISTLVPTGVAVLATAVVAVLATAVVGTTTLPVAAATVVVTGRTVAVAGCAVPREHPTIPTIRQIPSASPIPHLSH